MVTTHRFPPEAQPEEHLAIDEEGRQVLLRHDPAAPVISSNPDGTETLRPASLLHRYADAIVPADPARDRSARWMLEYAIARLLQHMVIYQEDHQARIEGLPPGVRAYCFTDVFQGSPRAEDEPTFPCATVSCENEVTYDDAVRGVDFVEETLGRWKPNTVLRRLGSATARVEIVVWAADKEQHDAIEAALERQLLVDPGEDLYGRRIVLDDFYDQTVRVGLVATDRGDLGPETVERGEWPLKVTVQAEIDRVILVQAPPMMGSLFGSSVGPTVEITP